MLLSMILNKYSNPANCSTTVYVGTFESPVGKIISVADDDFLYIVSFEDSKNLEKKVQILASNVSCCFIEKKNKILLKFEQELTEYFEGKLRKFTIPVKTIGSDFQKEVWDKLQEIPYASTQTYGGLAKVLGRPNGARAIGAACGTNAHMLVIPCHRLVASGSKGGFSSGVDRKAWLLQHEQKYAT